MRILLHVTKNTSCKSSCERILCYNQSVTTAARKTVKMSPTDQSCHMFSMNLTNFFQVCWPSYTGDFYKDLVWVRVQFCRSESGCTHAVQVQSHRPGSTGLSPFTVHQSGSSGSAPKDDAGKESVSDGGVYSFATKKCFLKVHKKNQTCGTRRARCTNATRPARTRTTGPEEPMCTQGPSSFESSVIRIHQNSTWCTCPQQGSRLSMTVHRPFTQALLAAQTCRERPAWMTCVYENVGSLQTQLKRETHSGEVKPDCAPSKTLVNAQGRVHCTWCVMRCVPVQAHCVAFGTSLCLVSFQDVYTTTNVCSYFVKDISEKRETSLSVGTRNPQYITDTSR